MSKGFTGMKVPSQTVSAPQVQTFSKHAVGMKVFVVVSATETHAHTLGWGHLEASTPEDLKLFGPTPKIRLEDGSAVYGCEVWWMEESRYEKFMGGKAVIPYRLVSRSASGAPHFAPELLQ